MEEHGPQFRDYPSVPAWLQDPVLLEDSDQEILVMGKGATGMIHILTLNMNTQKWQFDRYASIWDIEAYDRAFLGAIGIGGEDQRSLPHVSIPYESNYSIN